MLYHFQLLLLVPLLVLGTQAPATESGPQHLKAAQRLLQLIGHLLCSSILNENLLRPEGSLGFAFITLLGDRVDVASVSTVASDHGVDAEIFELGFYLLNVIEIADLIYWHEFDLGFG